MGAFFLVVPAGMGAIGVLDGDQVADPGRLDGEGGSVFTGYKFQTLQLVQFFVDPVQPS